MKTTILSVILVLMCITWSQATMTFTSIEADFEYSGSNMGAVNAQLRLYPFEKGQGVYLIIKPNAAYDGWDIHCECFDQTNPLFHEKIVSLGAASSGTASITVTYQSGVNNWAVEWRWNGGIIDNYTIVASGAVGRAQCHVSRRWYPDVEWRCLRVKLFGDGQPTEWLWDDPAELDDWTHHTYSPVEYGYFHSLLECPVPFSVAWAEMYTTP